MGHLHWFIICLPFYKQPRNVKSIFGYNLILISNCLTANSITIILCMVGVLYTILKAPEELVTTEWGVLTKNSAYTWNYIFFLRHIFPSLPTGHPLNNNSPKSASRTLKVGAYGTMSSKSVCLFSVKFVSLAQSVVGKHTATEIYQLPLFKDYYCKINYTQSFDFILNT